MSCSLLPYREAELMVFASNFAARVVAEPQRYGLIDGDAAQIQAAADGYAQCYQAAASPLTRTAGHVSQKNAAKQALLAILRGYSGAIKANRAVADAARIELGIGVPAAGRTAIPAPATRPLIEIVQVDYRRHRLRFTDSASPQRDARPAGCVGLQFFCHVGDAPPADPLSSRFQSLVTRARLAVEFKPEECGRKAFYVARWQTRKGLVGPWSVMVSMAITG